MYNDDEVFLGHLAYDPVTRHAAQSLYAQLEVAATPDSQRDSGQWRGLEVLPWHDGAGMLKVTGVDVNGGRDFLALHILGSTDPRGGEIISHRPHATGSG